MHDHLLQLSARVGSTLAARGWRVATAESCTGGGVAAALTAIAGSSAWFEYGIVSYANVAKEKLLGVSARSLQHEGAVSELVVKEMVQGVLALSGAELAVAISGIAGPGGGTAQKPVGTVWFAWATAAGDLNTELLHIEGDRNEVQSRAVSYALEGLLVMCDKNTV